MAIINNKVKAFKDDRNENVFIGIDLPFQKSDKNDGWFKSTTTTFEAITNNVKSLLNTQKGERLMQPSLGLNLKKYLFEPLDDNLIIAVENDILNTFEFWLPFVIVKDIQVKQGDDSDIGRNTLKISVSFTIRKNENYFETVSVTIGE